MKTHYLHLHAGPFAAIASGRKTIESRLYDEKRRHYAVGDELVFESRDNPGQTLSARITHLHRYTTFAELFAKIRHGFPLTDPAVLHANIGHYYSADDEHRYGVVGIEFELLTK